MLLRTLILIALICYDSDLLANQIAQCSSNAGSATVHINALLTSYGTTHEIVLSQPSKPNNHSRVRQINLNSEVLFLADPNPAGNVSTKLIVPNYSNSQTTFQNVNLKVDDEEVVLTCRFVKPLNYQNVCRGKSSSKINQLLLSAAKHSSVEQLEQALSCGADVNYEDTNGCTSLIASIEQGGMACKQNLDPSDSMLSARQAYIANRLLDLGAYYDVTDSLSGQSVVHRAASFWNNGDYNILKLLIALDADINVQDNLGLTPIMFAAKKGLRWSVEALLEGNPDLSLTDVDGKTAYDHGLSLASETRDKLALVKKEVTIEGQSNGSCSPLSIELAKGERVRVVMKAASSSMFMLTAPQLGISLMANAGQSVSKIVEPKAISSIPFECGIHGGKQSKGAFIIK